MTRRINQFFFSPLTTKREKKQITDRLNDEYDISDEQALILRLRYVEKKGIGFIADTLNYSETKVKEELTILRQMLDKII